MAEVLGDQQGGRGKLQLLLIDVVEGLARFKAGGDGVVDLFHGQAFQVEDTFDDDGFLFGLFFG